LWRGRGKSPLGFTSPRRTIWAASRTFPFWQKSAGKGMCPFWWITPTGPICPFCLGAAGTIALGAALCCDSGHKTLPVLTGGAYLHLARGLPLEDGVVRIALCLFGSTSPSYLILQSLDLCNRSISEGYPQRLEECIHRLETLKEELNAESQAAGCPTALVRP